jgi:phage terminase large subunit-like protein
VTAAYVTIAERYARDVRDGKIVACKWIKLACERHLRDRARSLADPEWGYQFRPALGDRVCQFIERLPHIKGRWARDHERLHLEPWQCFMTVVLFGWVRRGTALRRFQQALLFVARKNGKSTWAAAIGLWMFTADREAGAEVYSGAAKNEKQAWEVFGPARQMAKQTPDLRSHFGIDVLSKNMNIPQSNSKFQPIIGKPGDGMNPSCAIHDEYHEHKTDEQVDAMRTGMGAREQPLQLIITTAGYNIACPCYQAMRHLQRVLEGVVEDDRLFGVIYCADKDDDWTSDEVIYKANPNLGVSVQLDDLQAERTQALTNPRKQGVYKTKKLNLWVQSRDAFFNTLRWIECKVQDITMDDFLAEPCTVGVDLASKVDIAAVEILFDVRRGTTEAAARLREDGFDWVMFGRHYLPEAALKPKEHEHYRGWQEEGRLIVTDGEALNLDLIESDLRDLFSRFQMEKLAYDPYQAMQMMTRLMGEGVPVMEFRPHVLNFSEPMKSLDALILSRQIAHDGDPVMAWMISNVIARVDAKDNVYPRKELPQNKIDGPVALISAIGVALAAADPPSVYEERGFRIL